MKSERIFKYFYVYEVPSQVMPQTVWVRHIPKEPFENKT